LANPIFATTNLEYAVSQGWIWQTGFCKDGFCKPDSEKPKFCEGGLNEPGFRQARFHKPSFKELDLANLRLATPNSEYAILQRRI